MATSGGADDNGVPEEIQGLTFEQARGRLEEIVQRLESADATLDESIELYTQGTHLLRHCEAKLRAARERVERIVMAPDGALESEPIKFD